MAPGDPPLEIWGGVECSHVLVHGQLRDQLSETGHGHRAGDLDLIAGLGLRVLRYPVLWARARNGAGQDFAWEDARLGRLAQLGIDPIAGFLHHGSGPGGMDPLHPGFVAGLEAHAGAVAMRYPWLRRFTPINEPVTTARFSYLYGHWHPHRRDEGAFLRAVVQSALATAAAMARIRQHIPDAALVQTEDLGRVFAHPSLAYQADYENERRFLGLDLLTGRVVPGHGFWDRLLQAGVEAGTLDRLAKDPCPPQLVGLDHYLTSDRYLDPRLDRHPPCLQGGNGRHAYADVAAVHRPALHDQTGFLPRLREVHARYGLPLALTEVHNGAPPEGQLRWLADAWEAATVARAEGIPVAAVTSWSLFGCMDWASLLCARQGLYEPGAFDARGQPPRCTAVGQAVAALARTGRFDHPVLAQADWWHPPAAPGQALLDVRGPSELVQIVLDCCTERRIRACSRHGPDPGMARIGIRGRSPRLRLVGRMQASALTLEHPVDPAAGFAVNVHAFLDKLIEAGPWDQMPG